MTREEAARELEAEWEEFLKGTGLKYKTKEAFHKELESDAELKQVVEANMMAIEVLKQEPVLDKIKAEIEQIADEEQKHDEKWAIGLRYAIKIIDKYKDMNMDKNCSTCLYCKDGICCDEACAGCFDDPEHRNYKPRLKQTDFCDDYDSIYCEGRDCSECSYSESEE